LVALADVTQPSPAKVEPSRYGDLPYVGLEHIESGTRRLLGHGYAREAKSTKALFRRGDVLYGKLRPYLRKVWRAEFDGVCSTDILVYPPAESIDGGFLTYVLSSEAIADHAVQASAGINLPRVNAVALGEAVLALPPLAEQRRIAARLDELLAGGRAVYAALEEVPALLSRHRQALLAAAFDGALTSDWRREHGVPRASRRELPWREVGRCQNGRAFPSAEYAERGTKLLRPGNLHVSGRVEWSELNTRYMPDTWAARHPGFVVGPGEIVMNLTAQSLKDEFLGRVCMTGADERCLLNQRIARLTPTGVQARYAFWALKSPQFRRYVDGLNTGSLIQHMFTSQVDEFVLPVPTEEEQEEIVRRVEELLARVDRVAHVLPELIERLGALEQSALAKAFRGELVPQDPNDEPAAVLLERVRAATRPARAQRRPRAGARG
jgi:type I restriction enzyme S subunit